MKKFAVLSTLFCGLLTATSVQATIAIDSMLKFAEDGQTSFLVTNSASYRQFLRVGISNLSIENGEIVATPYTKENIADWRLSAKPSRSIVDPKMQKELAVAFQAKHAAENDKDQAFQLSIVPAPYFAEGEKTQHVMQLAIGFAPYVIVPAKTDQPLQFEIEREQNQLVLKNHGKTYIRTFIDACPSNTELTEQKKCTKTVHALSGRNLRIDLPKDFQKAEKLKISLTTHKAKYKDKFDLKTGQARKA